MSIEPITIPMSIESNDVTIESTFDARIEVVEGGSITVESLSVNTNGTTTAPTGKAYSPVVVNVPNSYTNSDEGKVVKNGALTSQTSTTKSANGTYDTTTNNQVTVAVPASAVDAGTKNITSNGNNQDVVGYAAVNVSVPNSYSAADEGKVVSSGALVSQTSDTVTTNDTYDTTLINSLTVNVSGGGGGLPGQLVFYDTITPVSNATSSNKISVQLPVKTNYTIAVYADSKPDPDSSLSLALAWIKAVYPNGTSRDPVNAILRVNGTIGSDTAMCSYSTSTGILQLGGQYGVFKAGLKYHIYMIAVDY